MGIESKRMNEKGKPKKKKSQLSNILFLIAIVLLIVPQTRIPIQIALHKVVGAFGPSVKSDDDAVTLDNYNWQLINDRGEQFDFNDAKNKVVIINFWATWCPPCIAEMPSLNKLYKAYEDKVILLYVSDEANETLLKFKDKNDYNFPVYHSIAALPSEFDVTSIPRTFVIDKKGRVVVDKTGAANWFSNNFKEELDKLIAD